MPLESATLLEKGGRKTFVTKTGNVCALIAVVHFVRSKDCEILLVLRFVKCAVKVRVQIQFPRPNLNIKIPQIDRDAER